MMKKVLFLMSILFFLNIKANIECIETFNLLDEESSHVIQFSRNRRLVAFCLGWKRFVKNKIFSNCLPIVGFGRKVDQDMLLSDLHLAGEIVQIWDIWTKKCIRTIRTYGDGVGSVAFSQNGKLIAVGLCNDDIKIFDIKTGRCIKKIKTILNTARIVFSNDDKKLVVGMYQGIIKIFDIKNIKMRKLPMAEYYMGYQVFISSVAFSPNGEFIASGLHDDKTIKIHDVGSGECIRTFQGYRSSVVFSPGGKLIASGSCDETIRIWDIEKGKCIKILKGHTNKVESVVFSPDGKLIASGSCDETIRIWDVKTGKVMEILKVLGSRGGCVISVKFNLDGTLLFAGFKDGTIKIWKFLEDYREKMFLNTEYSDIGIVCERKFNFLCEQFEDLSLHN
ncbi:WD40 repeat domain-containing protein [Candidatus Babeliales bacterium]|nr:WD40 repeat domain-containing protein [Candidatus Babeliales bacterium]